MSQDFEFYSDIEALPTEQSATFKQKAAAMLARAARGKSFTITRRDVVAAVAVPANLLPDAVIQAATRHNSTEIARNLADILQDLTDGKVLICVSFTSGRQACLLPPTEEALASAISNADRQSTKRIRRTRRTPSSAASSLGEHSSPMIDRKPDERGASSWDPAVVALLERLVATVENLGEILGHYMEAREAEMVARKKLRAARSTT